MSKNNKVRVTFYQNGDTFISFRGLISIEDAAKAMAFLASQKSFTPLKARTRPTKE